ncbi:MAG: phosphomannomutase/phosphoglucomutase [Candidatus Parcubacteria bacterium]|nr:phosphomannomutase/phosphoglucomutase [Candidatus Parcubacteria bacterium]
MINPSIFKAYDVRGIYPTDIDEDAVYKIAQAYVKVFKPKGAIALGKDVRLSSPSLWQAAAKGINDAGFDVIDIGTISTDMLYFSVAKYGYSGGITISASHNPGEYNGLKFVREKAIAISGDTGIMDMRDQVLKDEQIMEPEKGEIIKKEILTDYVKHCLSFIDPKVIKPMKIVANANFGMAGVAVNKILEFIPVEIVPLDFEPNGNFPKGRPDPMIPDRRKETEELVRAEKADLGVAWDADADRIFLFDENGEYVDNYFLSAILAKFFLAKSQAKEKIIMDPRQYWAVKETVAQAGGESIMNKVGHALIKDGMRKNNVLFAGEITGHFYFRDNFFCDNGMIPLLIILEMLSNSGQKMSDLAKNFREKYFISGELNQTVADPDEVIRQAQQKYQDGKVDLIDGVGVEYDDWRFNLRKSNTEPLIRLNVEAKSQTLVDKRVKELLTLIK